MVKLRHKKSGAICSASRFNMSSISEIYVCFEDEMDTDYMSNYDVEVNGAWKDLGQAFKDHDVITDNYNTRFFYPTTEEDRVRGFTE